MYIFTITTQTAWIQNTERVHSRTRAYFGAISFRQYERNIKGLDSCSRPSGTHGRTQPKYHTQRTPRYWKPSVGLHKEYRTIHGYPKSAARGKGFQQRLLFSILKLSFLWKKLRNTAISKEREIDHSLNLVQLAAFIYKFFDCYYEWSIQNFV